MGNQMNDKKNEKTGSNANTGFQNERGADKSQKGVGQKPGQTDQQQTSGKFDQNRKDHRTY